MTIGSGVLGLVSVALSGGNVNCPLATDMTTGARLVRTVVRPLSGLVPGTSLHISAGGAWNSVPPVADRAARPSSAVLARVRLSVVTVNEMWASRPEVI